MRHQYPALSSSLNLTEVHTFLEIQNANLISYPMKNHT
jgi:hypothetical protein